MADVQPDPRLNDADPAGVGGPGHIFIERKCLR